MSKDLDNVVKIINATAFEKDKTYLINVDCGDIPKESTMMLLQHIREIFNNKGIDVIIWDNHIKIEAIEIKRGNENDL